MSTDALIICVVIILTGIVIIWFTRRKSSPLDSSISQWLQSTQQSLITVQGSVTNALRGATDSTNQAIRDQRLEVNERLKHTGDVLQTVHERLGELQELGRSIQNLERLFTSPKLRGSLGEVLLIDLIASYIPPGRYKEQYRFSSGVTVDCAVITERGLLPIDAKFPLSAMSRYLEATTEKEREKERKMTLSQVQGHAESIATKYITPDEGTVDFAFMYLPSEVCYLEVVSDTRLLERMRALRVYPVSPTTLPSHLQIVLLSMQGKAIEERSQELLASIAQLSHDHEKLASDLALTVKHITNAYHAAHTTETSRATLEQTISKAHNLTLPDDNEKPNRIPNKK